MSRYKHIISVIVPVFNEAGNIKTFHKELKNTLDKGKNRYEIIYIDDHSTDGTFEWLQNNVNNTNTKILQKQGKKGKAFSLIEGFNEASGSVFVMIDGDLQYPPHAILEMLKVVENADIVVANRKDYKDSLVRKVLSNTFRFLFGHALFGLSTDIQSGLKVFTREVFETVKFDPFSPWTFDLEFLYRAKQAGFQIRNINISFSPRMNGNSKVSVVKTSLEIGLNALFVKGKKLTPFSIPAVEDNSMKGAGVGYKKNKYITHTTLPSSLSALQTFSLGQKLFMVSLLLLAVAGFTFSPLRSMQALVAILSILYFIDTIFNLFIVLRSLNKYEEIHVEEDELVEISESSLPIYSILCPLYKEVHVLPQFLEAIRQLDWPKEKLDVIILLEEDDEETISAFEKITLPYYVRTLIVPHSFPKTKPKACNYGLAYAKGKYLVIYDAEDIPDRDQLKKAYLGFQKVPGNVKCLQAKLNYYNARQNIVTRFFAAEYSLWFDVTLTGLQSLNSAIPLGGTSNHFETKTLKELQGWDPFNVTEDADLGVRLFQRGYRTAIIDSMTYEEATSKLKNWLRQRSRWIKGYMQTYLVHMRNFRSFVREKGIMHNLIFQLTIGGKLLFILLNPLMWIVTILYFAYYQAAGSLIESIYIPPISYIAVFSWIFGNFLFLYYYMIGCGKRNQWDITKYVLVIPFYWLMMSVAGAVALYQLLFKPHYWEKTIHGFHLGKDDKKEPIPSTRPVVQPAFSPAMRTHFAQTTRGGILASTALDTFSPSQAGASSRFSGLITDGFDYLTMPFVFLYKLPINFVRSISKIFQRGTVAPRTVFISKKLSVNLLQAILFLNLLLLDVVLALRYLPASESTNYVFLSLIGKTLFIGSQLGAYFIVSAFLKNKKPASKLYNLVFFTFLFGWIGFISFGIEGSHTISILLGDKFSEIAPYLPFYTFAFMCFAVANIFVLFHLKYAKSYTFLLTSLLISTFQAVLISQHHESIQSFIRILSYLGTVDLMSMILLQIDSELIKVIENNTKSLFALFSDSSPKKAWHEKRMSILIFNWRDTKHVYSGGAEVYIHELSKRWVKEGNKVTVFCGNDNKNLPQEKIDGVKIIRRGGTYTVYLFAFFYYLLKLRGKYDVIIDCENGIPFFAPLYTRKSTILLIHHVHQEVFRTFLRFPLNFVAGILEGKLMPLVYRNKMIVTVSESSRKEIVKLGFTRPENIEIIHNGVSQLQPGFYKKTEYPSFLYIGRLKEYKNIDIAIKAFASVLKNYTDARFLIAGSGESYPKLRNLVSELNIGENVKFLGKVTEGQKAKLLSESWVVTQPSKVEGWGITVIEANASGTPVIASKVNGLRDSVLDGRTGILVTPSNVGQLSRAMSTLVEDKVFRNNLSQNAVLWSKNFNWDRSAEHFYMIIGKSLRERLYRPTFRDIFVPTINKQQ